MSLRLLRYFRTLERSREFVHYDLKNYTCTIRKSLSTANSGSLRNREKPKTLEFTQRGGPNKNAAIVADVSSTVEELNSFYKSHGRINYEQMRKLVTLLEQTDNCEPMLTSSSTFLLRCCGAAMPSGKPEERLELFQNIWDHLSKDGKLSVEHYYLRLQVLQQNQAPMPNITSFVEEVSRVHPTAADSPELWSELLAVACSRGEMEEASKVLAEMKKREFALNERNFNDLIMGHGRNKDLEGVQSVVRNMLNADVPASLDTQTMLIHAYLENNEAAKGTAIFNKYKPQFDVSQVLKLLHCSLNTELEEDLIVQLVSALPKEYVSDVEVPVALRNLCIQLLHRGKLPVVNTILSTMPGPVFNGNQDTDTFGVFLLNEVFFTHTNIDEIIKLAQMLVENKKNTRSVHIVTGIALKRNHSEAAALLKVLSQYETLRPHYFWPMMISNFQQHGESGIVSTLKAMTDLKVDLDSDTFTQLVLPRFSTLLEDPVKAVKILNEAGVKTSKVLTDILVHLIPQNKLTEIHKLCELYPTKVDITRLVAPLTSLAVHSRATKQNSLFAKLLLALQKKNDNPKIDFVGHLLQNILTHPQFRGDPKSIGNLIDELSKLGLSISHNAYEGIQTALKDPTPDCLKKLKMMKSSGLTPISLTDNDIHTANNSSFIKHPRNMSLEELECHFIELESKGLNTRGVLRRLLQLNVRHDRLDRALELKKKCDELRLHQSPGMMASIFDMYTKLEDLPKASKVHRDLQAQYPGFQIDAHKIIDYASLLVQNGKLNSAKEILQNLKTTQKTIGGDYVLKNIWKFLTNVAHLAAKTPSLNAGQNLTSETYHILKDLGLCRPHNTILGPIVREYLLRGDIVAAVNEFKALAELYKCTPLQFELLSLLVRMCNENGKDSETYAIDKTEATRLLGDVTTVIRKVHSEKNLNSALLLALAESGTDAQLRRLLIDPEFRINKELLSKNCEHLGQTGSVQTLLRLARCVRGLHHVVDEQSIYDMILDVFVKENHFEHALELYEYLEADDELKISQEFLKKLINLLKYNNVGIPNGVALRAQVI